MKKIRKINAKKFTLSSFLLILGLALGVLFSAQFKSLPIRVNDPILQYTSLKDTRGELYVEQNQLKTAIKNLQEQIDLAQRDTDKSALSGNDIQKLNFKKAQAGLSSLSGPGVVVQLSDSRSNSNSEDAIVHAADLRDTLTVLWSSGAEAISVNGQRVVLNTAIDCIVNTILINNQRISAPFQINAIGPKDKMQESLKVSMTGLEKRKKTFGLVFDVSQVNSILVPAYDGSFNVKSDNLLNV